MYHDFAAADFEGREVRVGAPIHLRRRSHAQAASLVSHNVNNAASASNDEMKCAE
jgi:hypothetical protein